MSLFEVDQKKCVRCGSCSEVCPSRVIELTDGSFPTADMTKVCINCGHCSAVCPNGALSLETMPIDQCPLVEEDLFPAPEALEYYIKAHRSTRNFKDKPVQLETILRVIDIVRYSPTVQNSQPVSWVVVYDREEVKRMTKMAINSFRYFLKKDSSNPQSREMLHLVAEYEAGLDPICLDAPHIFVASAPKDNIFSAVNCTTALTYLELMLPSFGLGGCRAEHFDYAAKNWPPLQNALGFPKTHNCFGALLIGYPKYKYHRLPLRNNPSVTWHK